MVQELRSDHRLVGRRGEVLLVRSEVCNDGECTFATMALDGTALATVPAPVMPYNGRVRTGLITADGSTAVFGWVGKVTDPGEIRALGATLAAIERYVAARSAQPSS